MSRVVFQRCRPSGDTKTSSVEGLRSYPCLEQSSGHHSEVAPVHHTDFVFDERNEFCINWANSV